MTKHSLKKFAYPWPLRLVSAFLLVVQATIAVNAEAVLFDRLAAPRTISVAKTELPSQDWQPPSMPVKASLVAPVAPARPVSVREQLSGQPSDQEITSIRLFPEPLFPIGKTTLSENQSLGQALVKFSERTQANDASMISDFLTSFPESAWRPSLLTTLGGFYEQSGRFSKAIQAWSEVWELSKQSSNDLDIQIANQALIQLARLNSNLGRQNEVETLLAQAKGRRIEPGINALLVEAKEVLALMNHSPETTFLCGPAALSNIRAVTGLDAFPAAIGEARATEKGFNLGSLCKLANGLKMDFQVARRNPGAPVIVPSVIHWKVGHYSAIVNQQGGRYRIQGSGTGGDLWMDAAALDEEGSGYYLIPQGSLPQGWTSVSAAEADNVWGKGPVTGADKSRISANDAKSGGDDCHKKQPMASYAFHTMMVNLNINDTPVSYAPPRGPAIDFTVTYNHLEDQQTFSYFPYSNLGRLWSYNWLSYVQDISASNDVSIYLPGGGSENYTYDASSGTFQLQPISNSQLVKTGSGSTATYERRFPDGSKQIYAQLDGSAAGFTSRRVYLSQIQDVQSNLVSLVYDNATQHRLLKIVDALGQQTTLAYYSDTYQNGTNANFYKIKTVTDPWGRKASFTYNTLVGTDANQLATITDVGGLVSQFTYASDGLGFITAMGTPYGTTTFATGYDTNILILTRWLQATDPLGQTERLEFNQTQIYTNGVHEVVPPDFQNFSTNYYGYRNSFFWDKNTMAQMGGVITPDSYNKATIYHWCHILNQSITSGTLESEKKPLESRVCYTYLGQTSPHIYESTNRNPSAIERVLDDGTTQTNQFQYNLLGNVTRFTDPLSRITRYNYSTNNIDLLEIRQGPDTNQQLLATYAYDPAHPHLPKAVTDASGRVTQFGYNGYGQLLAITNAKAEVTTFVYDTNGYLKSVTGALPGSTSSFTYDSAGRVQTITDSTGYTISCDYDVFDRLTKVHYPDGTFEQTVYLYLNAQKTRDRLGRWTDYFFDPLQRVQAVRDSLGRMTQFQWCGCGALEAVVDPLNRVTMWNRDIQGRVMSKIYPDGKTDNYLYETNTSRLKTFTDALNNPVRYSYFTDDNIKQIQRTNVSSANPSVQFTYDSVYNRVSTISTVEYATASYTYNYQAVPTNIPSATTGNGMLSAISASLSGNNYTVAYAYDELGRVTGRAIDGANSKVAYDALGRVTITTNVLGSFTNSYVGVTPRLATNSYPNGQQTVFSYLGTNGDERLSEISNQHSGTNLSKFDYTYDVNGQIQTWMQQADAASPQVYSYEYDRAGQLMSAILKTTGGSPMVLKQFAYLYDTAGNRTSEQVGGSSPLQTSLNSSAFNNLNQMTGQSPGGTLQVKH